MVSRDQVARVSGLAREIVAKRALILAALAAVLHVGVTAGWLPGDISEGAEQAVAGVIDAVAAVGAIVWIRSGVTPADPALAPRSTAGALLVETTTLDPGGHVHPAVVTDRGAHRAGPLPGSEERLARPRDDFGGGTIV